MNIKDLHPDDYQVVQEPQHISDLHPSDMEVVSHPQAAAQPDIGKLEAILRGGAQGATFNFGDELMGGLHAATSPLKVLHRPEQNPLEKLMGEYRDARDQQRSLNASAAKQHPYLYHGAELAGGFALPVLGELGAAKLGLRGAQALAAGAEAAPLLEGGAEGAAALAGGGMPAVAGAAEGAAGAAAPLADAAETAGSIASSPVSGLMSHAGTGAGIGAVAGLGASNADLTQGDTSGAANDVLHGAAFGGLMGGALGKLFSPGTTEALENNAEGLAGKAIGGNKTFFKKEMGQGALNAEGERVGRGIGRTVLDSGSLQLTGGPEAIMENINNSIKQGMNKLQDLLGQGQQAIQKGINDLPPVPEGEGPSTIQIIKRDAEGNIIRDENNQPATLTPLADRLKSLAADITAPLNKNTETRGMAARVNAMIDGFIQETDGKDMDLVGLNNLKREIFDTLKSSDFYKSELATLKYAVKRAGGVLNGYIEDLGNSIAGDVDPGLGAQIREVNRNVSNLITAQDTLFDHTAGEKAGSIFSPVDKVLGGIGAAGKLFGAASHVDPATATLSLGTLAAKKGAELASGHSIGTLGDIVGAKVVNAFSKGHGAVTNSIENLNLMPKLITANADNQQGKLPATQWAEYSSDDLNQMAAKAKTMLGSQGEEFSRLLQSAAGEDPARKRAVMFALRQSPAYRQMLDKVSGVESTDTASSK